MAKESCRNTHWLIYEASLVSVWEHDAMLSISGPELGTKEGASQGKPSPSDPISPPQSLREDHSREASAQLPSPLWGTASVSIVISNLVEHF